MSASRSSRGALVAAVTLFAAPGFAKAPASPHDAVSALEREYLDGLFKAKPHLATYAGDHRFDDQVVDYTPAALAEREKQLAAERKRADAIDRSKLTLDDKTDLEILDDGIDLELLYLREIKDWAWDPRLEDSFPYYDPREIVGERLSFQIHGDWAPDAVRRKAIAAQLRAMPKMLDGKEKAMLAAGVSKVHLEQAQKDTKGLLEFFDGDLKQFTEKDAAAEKARLAARAALEKYGKVLVGELPAKANHDWRLGKALYEKKFPLALQTKLTPEQAIPRAEKAFADARAELYAVSLRLYKKLFPRNPLPPPNAPLAVQKQVIKKVQDELSKDHPKPAELVAAHARNLDKLRDFITAHDLLSLPPKETLSVEAMPLFKRGSAAAEYLAPGVLDKSKKDFHAVYYVDPIDPTWPAEKVESYMRGQNDYSVELTAAHEAYPGHHTQFAYARKDLNPLRAVLWNGAMAEGWAVYAEGLLVRSGYGGDRNDGYRFDDVKGQMICATNILLDIKLQSGEMTDDEAVRFMVEEGFQEKGMAEKKLLRAKLDSTQLAQYWLGLDEIDQLEADYRKKVGKAFTQRAFDEALIGHGTIAVRLLRTYLLGE